MTDLMDMRLHQQIAHEIYRQQMLQRLPGKLENLATHQTELKKNSLNVGFWAKLQLTCFYFVGSTLPLSSDLGRKMFFFDMLSRIGHLFMA